MLEVVNTMFDRDLSWISFNGRVLAEAEREATPLLEKIKFLSIYSSNLDEFYRVRMPVLQALKKLSKKENNDIQQEDNLLKQATETIHQQQEQFGTILKSIVLPQLKSHGIHFIYNEPIPERLQDELSNYFLSNILAFLQPVEIANPKTDFFPNNNELYFLVNVETEGKITSYVVNIPSNELSRFYETSVDGQKYVLFIDDIIRQNLSLLFKNKDLKACYSFKITRNAEMELEDEYNVDIADLIEKQIQKRDLGLATRFLHEPNIPQTTLMLLVQQLNIGHANVVEGGRYHNLKDLGGFPIKDAKWSNQKWPKVVYPTFRKDITLHQQIIEDDLLINPPYQSYDSVLRFFNEAATDESTTEIYTTLYRVASDSKIVNALITAAKNGKKVTVLVELKARFDEANNIKWAKKMKAAGVEIIYSVTALKVHAKVALVKRKQGIRMQYTGLFATGNFNETTANFYTDHILMTAHKGMLRELELLFLFLARREKPSNPNLIKFNHLLVAQFNLQTKFLELIQREIEFANLGQPAAITIKLNNLEEAVMINKLYEAAHAGVKINLIIRGICRLVPTENITIRRIVDRYLEHGRIFLFHNNGNEEMFLGSADWMSRNIYRRIEVCFPIFNTTIKAELKEILSLQLKDNVQAVLIDEEMNNIPVPVEGDLVQSQYAIYQYLKNKV
ncbi:polyphosphate kinase 1 [Pedobacter chitinilyticus]|uniref:Polyphosphate kinase n=1 Tax=Pedobacter chitinilyticus TaxID=2233776 RepID=A0A3S4RMU7_9SPHI|nr:polyphosphate kinase 1 [Pedobacter chitinilyticus]RWU03874.1 polyphosphate kinase 1 [Pedobacter chitinilyticus]